MALSATYPHQKRFYSLTLLATVLALILSKNSAADAHPPTTAIKPRFHYIPPSQANPSRATNTPAEPKPETVRTSESRPAKSRWMEDDSTMLEKMRLILKNGIPARMTMEVSNSEVVGDKPSKQETVKQLALSTEKPLIKKCHAQASWLSTRIKTAEAVSVNPESIKFEYGKITAKPGRHAADFLVAGEEAHYLTVRSKRYRLQQVNFKQNQQYNIDGQSYPVLAHLIHQSDNDESFVMTLPLTAEGSDQIKLTDRPGTAASIVLNMKHILPEQRDYFWMNPGRSHTTPRDCGTTVTLQMLVKPTALPIETANAQKLLAQSD